MVWSCLLLLKININSASVAYAAAEVLCFCIVCRSFCPSRANCIVCGR